MLYKNFLFACCLLLLAVSCKPIYTCGEQKPTKKLLLPKYILTVINERDSLCTTLTKREVQIDDLNAELRAINASNKVLEKQYNELRKKSQLQESQLNNTLKLTSDELKSKSEELKSKSDELKLKSDELNEKEKLLLERETALNQMRKIIARQDSITNRLNNILRDALLGFKSDELSVEIKNGKVYVSMSDKLLFKSGSASVEANGVNAIKTLAEVLNKNSEIAVLIEGHTDSIPIKTAMYKDNWDLSVARATSIVRMLTDNYKVLPTRLTASGKGEFAPKASNSTPEGRTKNRRTEIILSPKLDEIMSLLKANSSTN